VGTPTTAARRRVACGDVQWSASVGQKNPSTPSSTAWRGGRPPPAVRRPDRPAPPIGFYERKRVSVPVSFLCLGRGDVGVRSRPSSCSERQRYSSRVVPNPADIRLPPRPAPPPAARPEKRALSGRNLLRHTPGRKLAPRRTGQYCVAPAILIFECPATGRRPSRSLRPVNRRQFPLTVGPRRPSFFGFSRRWRTRSRPVRRRINRKPKRKAGPRPSRSAITPAAPGQNRRAAGP